MKNAQTRCDNIVRRAPAARWLQSLGRFATNCAKPISAALLLTGALAQGACTQAHTSDRGLSTRGLYSDIRSKEIAPDVIEYTPDYALWSDGAQKRRWLLLPEGEQIDTSDMEHWVFPIGTRLFKEFSANGQLLETRLVERVAETGRFDQDYKLATYVWQKDQTEAHELEAGVQNIFGFEHDVPPQKVCRECHRGEPGAVLGVSAVQASRSGLLQMLVDRGLLSVEPEGSYELPGDEATAEAIGYVHANCGHCHSDAGQSSSDMRLHFSTSDFDKPLEASALYRSTLGKRITEWKDHPAQFEYRVVPGEPEHSALYYRMTQRGDELPAPDQMPPLATEMMDDRGAELIKSWIATLTPDVLARVQAAAAQLEAGAGDSER